VDGFADARGQDVNRDFAARLLCDIDLVPALGQPVSDRLEYRPDDR